MTKLAAAAITVAVGLTLATAANAGDNHCGWSNSGWNAPAGAVVLTSAPGPIQSVLQAVGETRTHSMMSHGAGGWVTHATMRTPGQNSWPSVCNAPATPSDLQNGFPGASQISQGGAYEFLYGNGQPTFVYFQNGNGDGTNRGNSIQSYLWNTMPYSWTTSDQDSSQGFYRLSTSAGGGSWTQYSLYQYRDTQGVPAGLTDWNDDYDYGVVCSTLLAYAQAKSGAAWATPAWTYNHTQVYNGTNGAYSGANNACNSGLSGWDKFAGSLGCFDFNGLCDEAGDQVANCFADGIHGSCYTSDSGIWHSVRDNGSTTARSVSPDAIGGWSGHPYGSSNPNPVWSYDGNNTVSWNSGGNVYGCWD